LSFDPGKTPVFFHHGDVFQDFSSKGRLVVKRIAASLLAVAIAVCFSFSTGCTPKGTEKWGVATEAVPLAGKDKDADVAIKNGKAKDAVSSDKDKVSATLNADKNKITIKQLVEAPEKDIEITVTVTGEKSGEEAKIKVTLKAKGETPKSPTTPTTPTTP